MKKSNSAITYLFASFFSATLLLSACTAKHTESYEQEKVANDSTQLIYACPMHPEVRGNDGDVCSKCGMALERVTGMDSTQMHSH